MMLLSLVLFMAVMLSIFGYVVFFRTCCGIPARSSYIFTLSLIGCVVYFAGLLNVLEPVCYAVLGLGYVLILVMFFTHRTTLFFVRKPLNLLTLSFILGAAVVLVFLSGYQMIHYDNFSHWAVAVKYMLMTGRIPDAASAIIDFKSYPLGTTSFIYFICRFAGNQQGMMLVAQGMLIFACFYAIFGVIRDTKRFMLIALLGMCLMFMTHFNVSIRVNNLLVDFLLPLYALAAIGCVCECKTDICKACIVVVPVIAMLLIVKTTGVFFALPCFAFLLYRNRWVRKQQLAHATPASWQWILGCAALALSTLIAWNVHTSIAFADTASKFSYDLSNLSELTLDKSPEDIQAIVQLFFQTAFSLDQLPTQGILLFHALAIVAYLDARVLCHKRWKLMKTLLLMDAMMVLYYGGILLLYVFSMPLDEALRLAGFDRYASSMVLFFIGGLAMQATADVENSFYIQQGEIRDYRAFKSVNTKSIYQTCSLVFSCIAALLLFNEISSMDELQSHYDETLPAKAAAVVGDNWTGVSDVRCLMYATDTDRQISDYYLQYVGRYLIFTPNVDAVSEFDRQTFGDFISTYDYFVIVESDANIKDYMRTHAGLEGAPGIYAVTDDAPGLQLITSAR